MLVRVVRLLASPVHLGGTEGEPCALVALGVNVTELPVADAVGKGLTDGSEVCLKNPTGLLEVRAHLEDPRFHVLRTGPYYNSAS